MFYLFNNWLIQIACLYILFFNFLFITTYIDTIYGIFYLNKTFMKCLTFRNFFFVALMYASLQSARVNFSQYNKQVIFTNSPNFNLAHNMFTKSTCVYQNNITLNSSKSVPIHLYDDSIPEKQNVEAYNFVLFIPILIVGLNFC